MGNLRFLKVFVVDPVSSKWITATNKKVTDLTANQLGIFEVDQYGVTVGGTGATPDPTAIRRIKFAQNLSDTVFGCVKSQIIELEKVTRWDGKAAFAAQKQITYIGWDEVDSAKNITADCGKELTIPIHIWEKKLARWYGPVGFNKNLVIDTSCCPDCGNPCTAADRTAIATAIALQINTGLQRDGDFLAGNELSQYLTATVVTNGLTGDSLRVGVKVETKAIDNDAQQALNSCDPIKYWEFQTYYFTVGESFNGICSGTSLTVTTSQNATVGTGWPAALAALEAESQGFDRVRDPVTSYPYSALNGYKILAAAGKKYDYYHLDFKFSHRSGTTVSNGGEITEPYEVLIACPTGTGDAIEDTISAWLAGRFAAPELSSGS